MLESSMSLSLKFSGAIGKKVLDLMMKGDRRIAQDIVTSLNWALVTDPVLIDSVVSSVLAEHPKQVFLVRVYSLSLVSLMAWFSRFTNS
jgi:Asp-tRNA(Asn)/Glu-tRNA(Gln) amidotransferase B subunit